MQRHFTLRPSLYLAGLILFSHLLAMGTALFLKLPGVWALLLMLVLLGSLFSHLMRDARLLWGGSCVALRIEEDKVVLITRNGQHQSGLISPRSVVTPYLVILSVVPERAWLNKNIVLLPDCMDAESFRRLRVALRWGDLPLSAGNWEASK